MPNDHLIDLYTQIKLAKDAEIDRMLTVLKPKVEEDPELQEIVAVLERWSGKDEKISLTNSSRTDKKAS